MMAPCSSVLKVRFPSLIPQGSSVSLQSWTSCLSLPWWHPCLWSAFFYYLPENSVSLTKVVSLGTDFYVGNLFSHNCRGTTLCFTSDLVCVSWTFSFSLRACRVVVMCPAMLSCAQESGDLSLPCTFCPILSGPFCSPGVRKFLRILL